MIEAIKTALREHHTPLPARQITRILRQRLRIPDLKKHQVNSVLYSNRDIFQYVGDNPPLWSLVSTAPAETEHVLGNGTPSHIMLEVERPRQQPGNLQAAFPGFLDDSIGGPLPPATTPPNFTSPIRRLFPWQVQALRAWRDAGGRGVVEAVTGSGKSLVAIQLLYYFIKAGRRCLILVPTTALQNQWQEEIRTHLGFTPISHFGGGPGSQYRPSAPLTIGIVNSVANESSALRNHFGLIIADEAHRYGATHFRRALLDSIPFRLGLTATLERSDDGVDEVLNPYFHNSCFLYDFPRARREQVVARYGAMFLGIDLDPAEKETYDEMGLIMTRKRGYLRHGWPKKYDGISYGEFIARAAVAAQRADSEGLAARAYISAMTQRKRILAESSVKVRLAERLAPAARAAGKSVFFCETQAAAESIADRLQGTGLRVEPHHSAIQDVERSAILDRLKRGNLQAVVAVHTLDEGVDVPNLVLGVVVAGTKQRRQMIQRMGRVLRKKPDGRKAVFVVIFAKNTAEDPRNELNGEESHFDVLVDNADQKEFLDMATLSLEDVGDRVANFVRNHTENLP